MRVYHLWSEYQFEGANLCCNSGVYSSREKAVDTLVNGLQAGLVFEDLTEDDWDIEELEIE